jgi:two-component system NtrC family response regulator
MITFILYQDNREIGTYQATGDLIRIGRRPENQIQILNKSVSGVHCQVAKKDKKFILEDLGSTNGTYLNDRRINKAEISPGDLIKIGEVTLKFLPSLSPPLRTEKIAQEVENLEKTISLSQNENLKKTLDQLKKDVSLLKQIEAENIDLKKKLKEISFEDLIGSSPAMQEVFALIRKVAGLDVSILIEGETGTGKELVARAIYKRSLRKNQPFITINCGAIPENLLESELFGYEKGAFTGAESSKKGKFELAQGGTIFLDEIGEISFNLQVKLLRVLQEKEIERVGGKEPIKVDVRIIAATNADLEKKIEKKLFREDLYYRLNVIKIPIPPLRERGDDIFLLAQFFLSKFNQEYDKKIKGFSPDLKNKLLTYRWPGNVRELENKLRRAVVLSTSELLESADLGFEEERVGKMLPLREFKQQLEEKYLRDYLKSLINKNKGNISQAAEEAEVDRKTFYALMKKYGLRGFDE